MKLPTNFFYIPGFNKRYAVKALPNFSSCEHIIYSLVAPGTYTPSPMRSKMLERGSAVTLAKDVGGWKRSYTVSDLIKTTMASAEFKLAALEYAKDHKIDFVVPTPGPLSNNPAQRPVWIIATVSKANGGVTLKFAQDPKQHTDMEAAYAEADRLATQNPGVEYAVFRNVRRVKTGGISRIDF